MTRYRAIMADPSWDYDNPQALVGNGGRGTDGGRVVEMTQVNVRAQYDTMTVDEICALDVASLADPTGCMLFLWVTNPFVADGSGARVVKAWGFKPVTTLTWGKTKKHGEIEITDGEVVTCPDPSMKTGHWFRSASEHCFVGVRGKLRRPPGYPALPTWRPHPRIDRHSEKPDIFHEYAEAAVPDGPWLELFARAVRPGWTAVGKALGQTIEDFIQANR